MNESLTYSKTGLELTEHFEDCITRAYPDPASPLAKKLQEMGIWYDVLYDGKEIPGLLLNNYDGKPWTIGYGHTSGVKPGMTCTMAQAEEWLAEDVRWAENTVKQLVHVPLTQGQYDALVDFVLNVGTVNFGKSTLLRKLNERDYRGAEAEFRRWDIARGKHMPGLGLRRQAETDLFHGDSA